MDTGEHELYKNSCKDCWYFSDKRTRICCNEKSHYYGLSVWEDFVCDCYSNAVDPMFGDLEPHHMKWEGKRGET